MARSTRASVLIHTRVEPYIKEYVAGGTVRPGHLLAFSSGEVIAHGSAAAQSAVPWFAIESPYTDYESSTPAIDTTYADGDLVRTYMGLPGDEIYALLEDEGNVAIGALLESAGDGTLQAQSTGQAVARALEAVNNTGGSGPVRIKVEVVIVAAPNA
jgi:hypothetical protein